jgi:hypothetical protein
VVYKVSYFYDSSCALILKESLGEGDFTRGLVNDPPRTLWTRELKVSGLLVITLYPVDCNAFHSSQVYRTLPHSTNVAFGYAQVPVLGLRCQLASSLLIGEVLFWLAHDLDNADRWM